MPDQAAPICLAVSTMRDEGAFIVEWVAWYRMLGFDLMIATNDCSDHSPALLDAFAAAGWLTHLRHVPPPGMPPQLSGLDTCHAHPATRAADWVLVCDADELLVLHAAETIHDFLGPRPWDSRGIAISWKTFGTSGHATYRPGLVHRQFLRGGGPGLNPNRSFKSLFRGAADFDRLDSHSPLGLRGDWAAAGNAWLNGRGDVLDQFRQRENHPIRWLDKAQVSHEAAQMNHYVLRSRDHFDMKRGTPAAANFANRYTDEFLRRRDRNGYRDDTALRFAARFDRVHDAAMALPGVARLHHLCVADYVTRLCAHQGQPARDDQRWQAAMAAAG